MEFVFDGLFAAGTDKAMSCPWGEQYQSQAKSRKYSTISFEGCKMRIRTETVFHFKEYTAITQERMEL